MPDDERPPIPPGLLDFAARMGFSRQPGESDDDFIKRLTRMQGHVALVLRAADYGAKIGFGMTSQGVRDALNHRLWELLADNDIRPGQEFVYKDRVYHVVKIYEGGGTRQNPTEVRVQLSRVEWDRENQRGRTLNLTAIEVLRTLGVPHTKQ